MKTFSHACAMALLLPLCWTAAAQKADPEPPAAEEKPTIILERNQNAIVVDREGGGITIFGSKDPDRNAEVVKRIDLGNGMGKLLIYKGDGAGQRLVLKFSDDDDGDLGFTTVFRRPSGTAFDKWGPDYVLSSAEATMFGNEALLSLWRGTSEQRAELTKMEAKARVLGQRVRRAEPDAREALQDELEALLREIFDHKQAMRATEISSMQDKLEEAQQSRKERESNRDEIIERRLNQLLGRSSKYDW